MPDPLPTADGPARLSRRHLLAAGAAGAAALGSGGLSSAYAAGTRRIVAAANKPVRGGTMTVGMITGGAAETLNPGLAIAAVDTLRCHQLYDTLFQVAPDIKTLVPRLAVSAESNKDATVWTFTLRDGVVFHDGKQFTADDLIWNFHSWGSTSNYNHALFAGTVDFKNVRRINKLTVQVPLLTPVAQFPSVFAFQEPFIIQNGATNQSLRTHPVGTGPFMFESFAPGRQSVFARNPHYWEGDGKPYVDKLVVNSGFTDENARLNALLGGEIDVSSGLPPAIAATQRHSTQLRLLSSHSSDSYVIFMRVDKGQFADVRVRQALKLIADREAMVTDALAGFGTVGNDITGVGCEYYLDLPAPKQDIEKAKSLLKAAGQENLSFTLPTSVAEPGFVEAATVYAAQCAQAGVKVNVNQVPAATYYTSAAGFLTRPICMDNGTTNPSLTLLYQAWYTKTAPYNETWWGHQTGGAAAEKLIEQAIAATDPKKATELWREVQMQEYTQGGTLSYAQADYIDACAPTVKGLATTPVGNLNFFRLLDGWIS